MATDWNLIRELMAAVIDSCEQIEAAGYTEQDRSLTVDVSGQTVSLQEFMTSAWTLPRISGTRSSATGTARAPISPTYPKRPASW